MLNLIFLKPKLNNFSFLFFFILANILQVSFYSFAQESAESMPEPEQKIHQTLPHQKTKLNPKYKEDETKPISDKFSGLTIIKGTKGGKGKDNVSRKSVQELNLQLDKLGATQTELNNKINLMHAQLISKFQNSKQVEIYLQLTEPLLGIIEADASLNSIPIIKYRYPIADKNNNLFPIFIGPLNLGDYMLDLNINVGILKANSTATLPQGKWILENKYPIKISPEISSYKAIIKINSASTTPTLEIQTEAGDKK